MLWKIRTQAVLLSVVPLASLLAILVLATALQQKTYETAYWAQHSELVFAESDAAMQSLDHANHSAIEFGKDLSAQNYMLYARSVRAASNHVANLEELVSDNALQEARAHAFGAQLQRAEQVLARYVAAARGGDIAAERALESAPSTQRTGALTAATQRAFDRGERDLAVERFNSFGGQLRSFGNILVGFLIAGIGLTLITMTAFGLRIVNRLQHLGQNARLLEEGESPIPLGGNDEIAELDRQYREMAQRMRRERGIASTLQRALLPQRLPAIPGTHVDTAYLPASEGTEVGGDWYDVFRLSDRVIGTSIGDVAGHGLRAARVMASLRQSIRTAARLTSDPAQVLAVANRLLCEEEGDEFATAFFATLDVIDGKLTYAVAGHPRPIVMRSSGQTALLPGSGLMLGIDEEHQYDHFESTIVPGDSLLLYTDGVVEVSRDYIKGVDDLVATFKTVLAERSNNVAVGVQHRLFKGMPRRDDSAMVFIRRLALTELPLVAKDKTTVLHA